MSRWMFLDRFMWWKRRKLLPDEIHVMSVDFLHEFNINPQSVLNGGEVFVLFRMFVDRYGRIEK